MKVESLIFGFIIYSCTPSKKEVYDLSQIELGMTVESVVEKLNLNNENLILIQEPPLIYRGIKGILQDSTVIEISFERIPADTQDISKAKGLKTISKLRIKGFAWKKKNGESNIIGEKPVFWNKENK